MTCEMAEVDAIHTSGRVVGSISFVGSLSIIACYFAFPSLQKLAFTLVVYMSIADVIAAIGDFLAPDEDHCNLAPRNWHMLA